MRNMAPVLKSNCWSWQHTSNCTEVIINGKIQVSMWMLKSFPTVCWSGAWLKCLSAPYWNPPGAARETLMVHRPPSKSLPASIRYHKSTSFPKSWGCCQRMTMKDVYCLDDLSSFLDTVSRGGNEKREYPGPRKQNTLLTQQWVRL